jgi:hypothetical protein
MEAARSSETLASNHCTALRSNPENNELYLRRENLKSNEANFVRLDIGAKQQFRRHCNECSIYWFCERKYETFKSVSSGW